MTLGDIIKNYRTENRYSMDEFAKKAGYSKAYISVLERNHNPSTGKPVVPTLENIIKIANAMGKDPNDVMLLLDADQKVKLPTAYDEEQLDAEIIERLTSLTEEELAKVDAFVQGLLASR